MYPRARRSSPRASLSASPALLLRPQTERNNRSNDDDEVANHVRARSRLRGVPRPCVSVVQFHVGYGAALSVVLLVLAILMTLVQMQVYKLNKEV